MRAAGSSGTHIHVYTGTQHDPGYMTCGIGPKKGGLVVSMTAFWVVVRGTNRVSAGDGTKKIIVRVVWAGCKVSSRDLQNSLTRQDGIAFGSRQFKTRVSRKQGGKGRGRTDGMEPVTTRPPATNVGNRAAVFTLCVCVCHRIGRALKEVRGMQSRTTRFASLRWESVSPVGVV